MADPLIQVFAETLNLPEEKISDATSTDNTPEWDSLAAMFLLGAFEDRFNVEFSLEEITKMRSVGIVREILIEKKVDLS
ncbi:MAG: acyl carrier protein [Magnetococcales bacterium]|nr:acyl carrier protein [Magnetococcales bacterium]